MRNWSMTWESVESGASGTVVLSNDPFWSDIRSGAILTFIEWTSTQGGLDTDTSFDPGAGDRWININTFDTTYVSMTTSNLKGHTSGQFDVDADDWRLTIEDKLETPVFGPAGEGSIFYYQDQVSNENIFRLEESPSFRTTPLGPYDDGASWSSFGAGNQWTLCPSGDIQQQDFSALPDCPADECLADLDSSGDVGVKDLLILLGASGPCPKKGDCPADFDNSGDVGVKDLLFLLGNWGACP